MASSEPWDVERCRHEAGVILTRFNALRSRVNWRRQHYNNDPAVDPTLGPYKDNGEPEDDNPFVGLSSYQSDKARETAQKLIPRMTENPTLVEAKSERESGPTNAVADDLGQLLGLWLADIQMRTGETVGNMVSYAQLRDCFGVMHSRRLDDAWPAIDYLWADALPTDPKEAKNWVPYSDVAEFDDPTVSDCENCDGIGEVSINGPLTPDTEECPDCSGMGIVMQGPKGKGAFRETADAYNARVAEQRANAGPLWTIEFPDAEQVGFILDRDITAGPRCAVWVFEVPAHEYDEAYTKEADRPTEMALERPAPGNQLPVGTATMYSYTPSIDGQYSRRVQISQIWTRTHYYEIRSDAGNTLDNCEMMKCFEHDLGRTPWWIIPAMDNGQLDPVYRYEPYLEGIYRTKPFWDHVITMFGGMAYLTAAPLIYYTQQLQAQAPQLADGNPLTEQDNSVGATALPQGMGIQTIPIQASPILAQFVTLLGQWHEDSIPETGYVEITAQTQPWTARQALSQANIGPSGLVENRRAAIESMLNMWKDWHERHPEEKMYARKKGAQGKVIEVDPKEIGSIYVNVSISKIGSTEQIPYEQFGLQLLDKQLIKREDFFRDFQNKRNPHDYDISLLAETLADPLKRQWLAAKLAQAMGSEFLLGGNGELLNSQGQAVDPHDALQAGGWQTPQDPRVANANPTGSNAPQQIGGPQDPALQGPMGQAGGMSQMGLPALAAPGQPAQTGRPF